MNPILIRQKFLFGLFFVAQILSGFAQGTIYVSGTIANKTTWSADTVKVTGDLTIDTLFIEPGTIVEFQGNYFMTVTRYLAAHGEAGDTILFTIKDTLGFNNPETTLGGWGGIRSAPGDIELYYCKIQYVKNHNSPWWAAGAVSTVEPCDICITNSCITSNYSNGVLGIEWCEILISESQISDNKLNGVRIMQAIAKIDGCMIRNNSGNGIYLDDGSVVTISNSVLEYNEYGIFGHEGYCFINSNIFQNHRLDGICLYNIPMALINNNIIKLNGGKGILLNDCYDSSDLPRVINNLIYNNNDIGISLDQSWGKFVNNTILKNSKGGIKINYSCSPKIMNCIVRDNGAKQILIESYNSIVLYNNNFTDIESGKNNRLEMVNNINLDPNFVNMNDDDFRLSLFSPCINAGTIDTTGFFLPLIDLDNNPRIYDGRIDMGAYEFQMDNFQILEQPISRSVCNGTATSLETEAFGAVLGYQWQKNGVDIPAANQCMLTFSAAGVADNGHYNCLIVTDDKTVSTDTVILTIHNLPELQLPKDTTIFNDEVLNIDAGEGFQSYLWNTGSENQILTLNGLTAGTHMYAVRVTDQNNCMAEDTIKVTVKIPDSFQEIEDHSDIIFYPNPVHNTLFLKTSQSIEDEVVINIVDNTGKLVAQKKFESLLSTLIYQIDVSEYSRGAYFIQIINKQVVHVSKIVIE